MTSYLQAFWLRGWCRRNGFEPLDPPRVMRMLSH